VIRLLSTSLAVAAFIGGLAFLGAWARRQVLRLRSGGLDPRCLEVVARVGLHANQGLAVVRVGRRHMLVSSGEGGARMLTELSEDDLATEPEAERDGFAATLKLHQAVRRSARVGAVFVLLACAGFTGAAPRALAQIAPTGPVGGVVPQLQQPPLGGVGPGGQFGSVFEALPGVALQVGEGEEGLRFNGTVGTVIVLGLLSLAPSLLLLTTSFTRIFIVLQLLRQALGTQNTPPGHLLAALAMLLTAAVMAPTFDQIRYEAVDPWVAGEIDEGEMLARAVVPLRFFMFAHTRDSDLRTFLNISRTPPPMTPADIPNTVVMSAFVTSELRTAFEIGFAIFLPFIVIDLVVAAVLTSMGMFMLPPTMIALPCKLMLFVLMDGWTLVLGTLAQSFL
jgi:flagellar biosynthesis protein FliP